MIAARTFLTVALALLCLFALEPAHATRANSSRLANEAKALLDAHFGHPANIEQAAKLLKRALAEDESDAEVWVQVARLTIKGGHVTATRFRAGTMEAYGELLDRALNLDANNAKAHIFKAEYFNFRGEFAAERAELDKAKALGTADSWLQVGYGRHFTSLRDFKQAQASYAQARARGPGTTLEQRNAYIAALAGLAEFAASARNVAALRSIAADTRKARDPRDAWALGNLAHFFFAGGMLDDSIELAREAIKTLNYGAARLTLACALYGKAAELQLKGDRGGAENYAQEAAKFGFNKEMLLRRFEEWGPVYQKLLPTLAKVIE